MAQQARAARSSSSSDVGAAAGLSAALKWGMAASALGGATYLALRSLSSGEDAWFKQAVKETDFDSFLVKQGDHPTGLGQQQRKQKKRAPKPTRRDGDGGGPIECFFKVSPPEEQDDEDEDVRNPLDFNSFLKTALPNQQRKPPAAAAAAAAAEPAAPSRPLPHQARVLVVFGTEFGFSKEIAEKLCARLRKEGSYWPVLRDMSDYPDGLPSLAQEQAVVLACSTQGDGVPPTEARGFCEWLFAGKAGDLSGVKFAVCALGDKSYTHFCRCGRLLDEALEKGGATRAVPRVDVNKEDWPVVDGWLDAVVAALGRAQLIPVGEDAGNGVVEEEVAQGHAKRWGKSRPFPARVVAVQPLCSVASADDKNTVRVELQLDDGSDAALQYLPGDALGIYPSNGPKYVDQLLRVLGADGSQQVPTPAWHYQLPVAGGNGEEASKPATLPLRDALLYCYDIKTPKAELFQLLWQALPESARQAASAAATANGNGVHVATNGNGNGTHTANGHAANRNGVANGGKDSSGAGAQAAALSKVLTGGAAAQEAYMGTGRHVVDVLREFSAAKLTLTQVLGTLRQLQPRLYSISSAPGETAGHLQATIAEVRYQALGDERVGVCSTYVSQHIQVGQAVPAYIHRNPDFRLPPSLATPIIMVGPGTGLAPFRSFILQRIMDAGRALPSSTSSAATAANGAVEPLGEMVLFFGCRRPDQDFLYGEELQALAAAGHITLHTAFSRLEAKKVYVQDRLWEQAESVWRLLHQHGAHFYVCGDASSMAGAVEKQLLAIIADGLQGDAAAAQAYLDDLSAKGRYQRDVWY